MSTIIKGTKPLLGKIIRTISVSQPSRLKSDYTDMSSMIYWQYTIYPGTEYGNHNSIGVCMEVNTQYIVTYNIDTRRCKGVFFSSPMIIMFICRCIVENFLSNKYRCICIFFFKKNTPTPPPLLFNNAGMRKKERNIK